MQDKVPVPETMKDMQWFAYFAAILLDKGLERTTAPQMQNLTARCCSAKPISPVDAKKGPEIDPICIAQALQDWQHIKQHFPHGLPTQMVEALQADTCE
jgi:hypothetical protein